MLKEIHSIFSWKNLLVITLFIGSNMSHASTLTSSSSEMINTNDQIFVNNNVLYLRNPITLLSTPTISESYIIYEDARVVGSDNTFFTGYFNKHVTLKEAGAYQVSLRDFNFPVNFDMLGLSISSSTEKMAEIWGNGSFNFEAEAGKYFINLVYKTDERLNLGKYGMKLQYLGTSAVPLPASLWLMLTGVAAIIGYRRKPK